MLYDTHKRYGQVAGLLSMPVAKEIGLLNTEFFGTDILAGTFGMIVLCVIGFYGAMFGAEFPDLDSPTSKPSQHFKILSKLFVKLGIKHRGGFSHGIVAQTVFWLIVFLSVAWLSSNVTFIGSVIVFGIMQVFVGFAYVGVLSHLFADAITVDGVWFVGGTKGGIKVRLMPVFIRKFGFGKWKPLKHLFTTAGGWNVMNYKFMSFVAPIAFVYALSQLFMVA